MMVMMMMMMMMIMLLQMLMRSVDQENKDMIQKNKDFVFSCVIEHGKGKLSLFISIMLMR